VQPAGTIAPGTAPVPRTGLLDPRARVLRVGGARVSAGVGPTHAVCATWCYVTDTRGDALLVFRHAELVRRLYLPGGPYGIALDARRRLLYVTLPARNELVQLPAHGRPHALRRWPIVRRAREVTVGASGEVTVIGDGVSERIVPTPRTGPR
jgi:hypothetical protein